MPQKAQSVLERMEQHENYWSSTDLLCKNLNLYKIGNEWNIKKRGCLNDSLELTNLNVMKRV